jgi:hypothetical protein
MKKLLCLIFYFFYLSAPPKIAFSGDCATSDFTLYANGDRFCFQYKNLLCCIFLRLDGLYIFTAITRDVLLAKLYKTGDEFHLIVNLCTQSPSRREFPARLDNSFSIVEGKLTTTQINEAEQATFIPRNFDQYLEPFNHEFRNAIDDDNANRLQMSYVDCSDSPGQPMKRYYFFNYKGDEQGLFQLDRFPNYCAITEATKGFSLYKERDYYVVKNKEESFSRHAFSKFSCFTIDENRNILGASKEKLPLNRSEVVFAQHKHCEWSLNLLWHMARFFPYCVYNNVARYLDDNPQISAYDPKEALEIIQAHKAIMDPEMYNQWHAIFSTRLHQPKEDLPVRFPPPEVSPPASPLPAVPAPPPQDMTPGQNVRNLVSPEVPHTQNAPKFGILSNIWSYIQGKWSSIKTFFLRMCGCN